MSIRTLHRRLRLKGLSRKHLVITSIILLQDVQKIISRSGYQNRGYRIVRQRLMQDGKQYSGNSIRLALQVLDPECVELRKKHRLKRRMYLNSGPNDCWHIDGNHKLKPFGLCIRGAIDGFSRKILCLKVSASNKDPGIFSYYPAAVKKISGLPRKIRGDTDVTQSTDVTSSYKWNSGKMPGTKVLKQNKNNTGKNLDNILMQKH